MNDRCSNIRLTGWRLPLGGLLFALVLLAPWWVWRQHDAPLEELTAPDLSPLESRSDEPIQPISNATTLDAEKVALGKRLFGEPRLSHDNTTSCASCHDLQRGGTDGAPVARGIGGASGTINTPTVFNSGLNFRQFWDGRAASLEDQIDGPIHNPVEMGSHWNEIVEKLRRDDLYAPAFAAIYADGITPTSIKDAITEYERSLLTPNSRFDRFLLGDPAALTQQELIGYRLFTQYGCVACHQGANVGGNLYQEFGVLGDYFADRARQNTGRAASIPTSHETHRHRLKVPGLRNVAVTGPYLHDGSVQTLEETVRIMGRYQLGRRLPQHEIAKIVAFLKTLTGEYQGRPL